MLNTKYIINMRLRESSFLNILKILDTVDTFRSLGFIIHPEKSMFEPKQEIEFLGFLLNSISMTIRLPTAKAAYVKKACVNLLDKGKITVRELAHVIGLLVSSLPGVQFGELHYRKLEINKTQLCREIRAIMMLPCS